MVFAVYLDGLLSELSNSGFGCYWRNCFVGAVCYVDGIACLAPYPSALRMMLDIVVHMHHLNLTQASQYVSTVCPATHTSLLWPAVELH